MLNNFIYAKSKAGFEERLDEIPNDAVAFIEETKEIWSHGNYFAGNSIDALFEKGSAENSAVLKGGDNQVISDGGVALGKDNIVGLKGWYYSSIYKENDNTISVYLSNEQKAFISDEDLKTESQTADESLPNLVEILGVNAVISLVNAGKYDDKFIVIGGSNGVVRLQTIDESVLPFDIITGQSVINYEDYSIYCLSKPDAGIAELGKYSFAVGYNNKATNGESTAFGYNNHAYGKFSFVEGKDNKAGYASHAEGRSNIASGSISHAEGRNNVASGYLSHAEGGYNIAEGAESHAEGYYTIARGAHSHAEGTETIAKGDHSHAEGYETTTNHDFSHAEGYGTTAEGYCSHAEGRSTYKATDVLTNWHVNSVKEKWTKKRFSLAYSEASHVEGRDNLALGPHSHAEGNETKAEGSCAHAEGYKTQALGKYSHAEGSNTISKNEAEHACGKYNMSNSDTRFSIGIGVSVDDRKNAFEVKQNGDIYIEGVEGRIQDKLNTSISATPDWNAKVGKDGHIKNRTHYYQPLSKVSALAWDIDNSSNQRKAVITLSPNYVYKFEYEDNTYYFKTDGHKDETTRLLDGVVFTITLKCVDDKYSLDIVHYTQDLTSDFIALYGDGISSVSSLRNLLQLHEIFIPDSIARSEDLEELQSILLEETVALWENVERVDGELTELSAEVGKKQDTITDLETIRRGAEKGATAIQEVKTINGQSIVGSGNIEIQGGGGSGMTTPSGDPMHYMFEAVGAEWNGTGADIEKQGVYGDTITHKAGYWYLNELGDITTEQMRDIYAKSFPMQRRHYLDSAFANTSIRTNFPIWDMMRNTAIGSAPGTKAYLFGMCCDAEMEVFAWITNSYSNTQSGTLMNIVKNYNISSVQCTFDSRNKESKLTKILGEINVYGLTSLFNMFRNAIALKEVRIYKLGANLDAQHSPNLSYASIKYMIKESSATNKVTLTLHATALANAESAYLADGEQDTATYPTLSDWALSKNIQIATA